MKVGRAAKDAKKSENAKKTLTGKIEGGIISII